MRLALKKTARPTLLGPVTHWLGQRLDGSPYSHAELVFTDGQSASSVMGEGVRFKAIGYTSAGAWDFWSLPDYMEPAAHRWFSRHQGQGYDYGGMARFWWGMVPQSPNRWTCSEAILAALGWPETWRYGPGGLLACARFLHGARQVAGPWPDDEERMHPALQRILRREGAAR